MIDPNEFAATMRAKGFVQNGAGEWEQPKTNPQQTKSDYHRKWVELNPEKIELYKSRQRIRKKLDPKINRDHVAAWRKQNPEKQRSQETVYRENNRDKYNAYQRLYRARKRSGASVPQKPKEIVSPLKPLWTQEARAAAGDRLANRRATNESHQSPYGSCRRGFREDLGFFCRSRWEANYARYLNLLVSSGEFLKWEYEAETFSFPIDRGTRTYTPDFKVTLSDGSIEYHEVKGWMDAKSKTRLNRMRRFHPQVKIVLIDETRYRAIQATAGRIIPTWEKKH